MYKLTAFIFLTVFSILEGGNSPKVSIQLLNEKGATTLPHDLTRDASWIGLAILKDGSRQEVCTATHIETEKVVTHIDCVKATQPNAALTLYYWDATGKQKSFSPKLPSPVQSFPIQILSLPESIGKAWKTSGNSPRVDETWFGGFHPDWELIRVYSFEDDSKEGVFHFQINTCKAAKKSPILKQVKRPSEPDEDEETISETNILPETPENSPVIEKCLRPLSPSSKGALITLAKSFDEKFGFLTKGQFQVPNQRQIAAQEGTVLKYIGADGLEAPLPKELSQIQLDLSFAFEILFPSPLSLK